MLTTEHRMGLRRLPASLFLALLVRGRAARKSAPIRAPCFAGTGRR